MKIQKAEKKHIRLRLAFTGCAGSGKTMSALKLAKGMGGKIGLIDTERSSSSYYSDVVDFDLIELTPPYSVERYIEALKEFEKENYDVVIIDSLSHAWSGEGGVLDWKQDLEKRNSKVSSYTAWNDAGKLQNKLIDTIFNSPMHIIITLRSKMEYVQCVEDGKTKVKRVGLSPVQRDDAPYEFDIIFPIDQETHNVDVEKDRSRIFKGKFFQIEEDHGRQIMEWLQDGRSEVEILEDLLKEAREKAMEGYRSLEKFWLSSSEKTQEFLKPHMKDLVAMAREIDKENDLKAASRAVDGVQKLLNENLA